MECVFVEVCVNVFVCVFVCTCRLFRGTIDLHSIDTPWTLNRKLGRQRMCGRSQHEQWGPVLRSAGAKPRPQEHGNAVVRQRCTTAAMTMHTGHSPWGQLYQCTLQKGDKPLHGSSKWQKKRQKAACWPRTRGHSQERCVHCWAAAGAAYSGVHQV